MRGRVLSCRAVGRHPRLLLAVATALSALAACATIAGLEGTPPTAADDGGPDGGGRELSEGITVTPESIAITTSCSGAGETKYITIDNQGDVAASYELEVPEGSAFALRDDADASATNVKGTVPPKQLVIVYLRVTSAKAGTFDGQVIVRVGERVTQVPVKVTVNGGALAFFPDLVDFGEVRQKTASMPQSIDIENTGTEAVNVLGFVRTPPSDAGAEFSVSAGGSINVPPGEKAKVTATLLAGDAGAPVTSTFAPETQSPTCGELPTLTLKGTRVNQDVTVNPVSLDFGDVDCASAGGATRTITVSNYGGASAALAVSTPGSSWFDVSAGAPSVPPASGDKPGTTPITVTLKPVGATFGTHSDPIVVEVTGPETKTTTVTATVKSVGAVLAISPLTLSGFAPDGTKSFGVRNTGNGFVYVRHTSSNTGAFKIDNGTSETPLAPGSIFALNVDVTFVAEAAGTHQAQITTTRIGSPPLYPRSGNLCEPAPVVQASATK